EGDRLRTALPHWAISKPKKNHVGLRISQVKLDTPTAQTPRHTIHILLWNGGIVLNESTSTVSIAQKIANPSTPCSTKTDKKVLCAGGLHSSGSSVRIGSAKTRLTTGRKASTPIPR